MTSSWVTEVDNPSWSFQFWALEPRLRSQRPKEGAEFCSKYLTSSTETCHRV